MFATSALSMGVNIPYIHRDIHYDMPGDVKQYVQEIGRGHRDDGNQKATAVLYMLYTIYHTAMLS